MNWLSEFVRPRIRTLLGRKEAPDNLWHQCSACQQMIFHRELETNLKVCPHCGHHMRATAAERLGWTFDGGTFQRIDLPKVPADPLKFQDRKKYPDGSPMRAGRPGWRMPCWWRMAPWAGIAR
ncbi:unnamed protein product [Acidocella sp. C78]|nr:unnamed protein product [Acidocella sp. C78]